MERRRPPYFKQKLRLYADENFPSAVVEAIRSEPFWKDKVTIRTAAELGHARKDDGFHLSYCRRQGLILVTLDGDFTDDRHHPLGHEMPAIIHIVSESESDIAASLATILHFLARMPFPQAFAGDSKFQVSREGAVMRGRHVKTREVKTLRLVDGMSAGEIAAHFGYFGTP